MAGARNCKQTAPGIAVAGLPPSINRGQKKTRINAFAWAGLTPDRSFEPPTLLLQTTSACQQVFCMQKRKNLVAFIAGLPERGLRLLYYHVDSPSWERRRPSLISLVPSECHLSGKSRCKEIPKNCAMIFSTRGYGLRIASEKALCEYPCFLAREVRLWFLFSISALMSVGRS